MHNKITREDAFTNNFLSYVIGSYQKVHRDTWFDGSESEEYVYEMNEHFDEICDCNKFDSSYKSKYCGSLILNYDTKNIDDYQKKFPYLFRRILEKINVQEIYILSYFTGNWIEQQSKYKPAKDAIKSFNKLIKEKNFQGALRIDIEDLTLFSNIIFWFNRCNIAFSDIVFVNEENQISGTICKYGNLHIEFYKEILLDRAILSMDEVGLKIIETENEVFSGDGSILERVFK